jgi:hypothetical protein
VLVFHIFHTAAGRVLGAVPSPQEPTRPTLICWESRSAVACCSRESTPKARGWHTPTAR